MGVYRIAQLLTIANRQTGARAPWKPYREQRQLWDLLHRHHRIIIAKPRKTGISTATELMDLMWTHLCDSENHRVKTVIALNKFDKAEEHHANVMDMAKQLQLPVEPSGPTIQFPNGSEMVFLSGGGKEPGRGGDISRLHITELPYWDNPEKNYHALRSSCMDNAAIVVETTMDSIDKFTKGLWYARDEFKKHFWRVQDHESYSMKGVELSDEEWELAQIEGFTRKDSAAWWLRDALPNKCAGNKLTLFHDYPQREEHLFAAGVGRVIQKTPKLALIHRHAEVPSDYGGIWRIEIYGKKGSDDIVHPHNHSGQVVIAVDTAFGRHKTNSVVLAMDKRDSRILACFASNAIRYDDLALVAQKMFDEFSDLRNPRRPITPTLLVEENGIGDATCLFLERMGQPFIRFDQAVNGNAEQCIVSTARKIEADVTTAPTWLIDECDELHKDEKGNYQGLKDVVMTYGMCLVHSRVNAYRPDPERKPAESSFQSLRERLKEDGRDHRGKRPPWGI